MCCLWIIHVSFVWILVKGTNNYHPAIGWEIVTHFCYAGFLGSILAAGCRGHTFCKALEVTTTTCIELRQWIEKIKTKKAVVRVMVWRGYTTLGYIPYKSNHLLRMVRESKSCAFGDWTSQSLSENVTKNCPPGVVGENSPRSGFSPVKTWGSIWGAFEETCGLFDLQLPYEGPWGQLRWWRLTVNFAHFSAFILVIFLCI